MKGKWIILIVVIVVVLIGFMLMISRESRRVPLTRQEIDEIAGLFRMTIPRTGVKKLWIRFNYRKNKPVGANLRLDCTEQAAETIVGSLWPRGGPTERWHVHLGSEGSGIGWWDFGRPLETDSVFESRPLSAEALVRKQRDAAVIYIERDGEWHEFPSGLVEKLAAHNDLARGKRSSGWTRKWLERSWP